MFIKISVYISIFFFVCFSVIIAQESNCTTSECHGDLLKKKIIHSPAEDDCLTCHEEQYSNHPNKKGKEFILVDSAPDLCVDCHDDVEATMKNLHSPFDEGECTACHSPHSSNLPGLLNAKDQSSLCGTCHDLEDGKQRYKHGPFVSNMCTSCHNGHQSNFSSLLVLEAPDLCFQCHEEILAVNELENVHAAFEDCLDCHRPHTSPAPNMLISDKNDLCFQCHEEVDEEIKISKVVHGPLKKEGQCVSCHSPHASKYDKLVLDEIPGLCFQCHNGARKDPKEKIANILDKMSKKFVHDPVQEGGCLDCHFSHVSENYTLLEQPFPKGNYSTANVESYALCFECHDTEMIETPTTTEATNFRNGNINLHFKHIMKKKSISCKNCHDVHAADHNYLIGNTVFFGKWEMPLNYKVAEQGGSCMPGCHEELSYKR